LEQLRQLYPQVEGATTLGERATLPGLPAISEARQHAEAVVEEGAGSNLWFHTGERTATGKPILANDPHLGFNIPVTWYLARIETPEGLLVGATSPGFPLLVLGHNGRVSWAFTNAYGDTADVFVEKLDPDDARRYLTPEGSEAFITRQERLAVRFGDPIDFVVRTTRHGPVISDARGEDEPSLGLEDNMVLALSHTALMPGDGTPAALFRVQRADSVEVALAAMNTVNAPQQNVALADISGRTALIAPGLLPIRPRPASLLPVPGWTGDQDWQGFIPFADVPQVADPPSDRLVNANNRLVGPAYPYDLGHAWPPPYRAEAIEAALDRAGEPHTVEASAAVQLDDMSLAAKRLLATVDWLAVGDALPPHLSHAMREWDGRMQPDRPEPLMFYAWLRALTPAVYADELGEVYGSLGGDRVARLLHTIQEAPQWCDRQDTSDVEDCQTVLADAWRDAYALLAERHGEDWQEWRWDAMHRARFRHLPFGFIPVLRDLFDVTVPNGGGRYAANTGIVSFDEASLFEQLHGAGFRAVYDLADLDRSRFVIAVGQSGNIFSPHYADLAPLWAAGETLELAPIGEREAAHQLHLLPTR